MAAPGVVVDQPAEALKQCVAEVTADVDESRPSGFAAWADQAAPAKCPSREPGK
ncbi:hypothetical protein ABZZ36_41740 [Actinacidiphila glaucinigra]|uniref:hypothetical protein n=1 Tax=Actinacidiphila glaucinigra TaxID=235986 RepID=UPI0033BB036F